MMRLDLEMLRVKIDLSLFELREQCCSPFMHPETEIVSRRRVKLASSSDLKSR